MMCTFNGKQRFITTNYLSWLFTRFQTTSATRIRTKAIIQFNLSRKLYKII